MAKIKAKMTQEPIILRSKKRRRSAALTVEPDGSVRVLAPMRTSMKWIESFIAQKADWIRQRQDELRARQKNDDPLKEGARVPFQGEKLEITLSAGPQGRDGTFLRLAATAAPDSPHLSEDIALALRLWYRKEARRILPERVAYWAAKTGLSPQKVMITGPQKRWGSCSAQDEIRLNWKLILLPQDLCDYVIVHELSHIPHKHHGSAFWRKVEKIVPDCKERRKRLRDWEQTNN
jgi:predicted metal-dependent hydrolase